MGRNNVILILSLVTPLLLGACGASECLDNQNSRPNAVFLASGGELTGSSLHIDSLTIVGVDAPDGVPLAEYENLSEITLPFRIGDTETGYIFRYGGDLKGLEDLVTFRYTPTAEFVSAACGAIYAFEDVEVSYSTVLIDSIVCPWKTINNIERDYIKIYFRVSDE